MATYTNTWNEATPADSTKAGLGASVMRQMRLDVRERLLKNMPIGMVIKWATDILPDGFLECDGSSLSKTDYTDLYTFLKDGGSEGIYGEDTTTFNLPDYRGYFLRGWDNGAGNDPDVLGRTDRGDGTDGDHVGTTQQDEFEAHAHSYWFPDLGTPVGTYSANPVIYFISTQAAASSFGGAETRPVNIYIRYIIRVEGMDSDIVEYVRDWNELVPDDDDKMGEGSTEIRKIKVDIRERIDNIFPVGCIAYWPAETVPDGWMECDGSEISRITYQDLFNTIENIYGDGDGDTTFNIPDMRGLFLRMVDGGAGIDPDKTSRGDRGDGITGDWVGTMQGELIKSHTHLAWHNDYFGFAAQSEYMAWTYTTPVRMQLNSNRYTGYAGHESRPINKTVMIIMKAINT